MRPVRRCSRSQKARGNAEVLACDGVGPSTTGVGLDGLAIGKIDNRQQNNNTRADWNDIRYARGAKRDKQRQRRFRTVGSGAECIEPKDRNLGSRPDALGTRLVGRERLMSL